MSVCSVFIYRPQNGYSGGYNKVIMMPSISAFLWGFYSLAKICFHFLGNRYLIRKPIVPDLGIQKEPMNDDVHYIL